MWPEGKIKKTSKVVKITESESQSKLYCHITLQVMQVNCLIPHDSKCSESVKEVRTW